MAPYGLEKHSLDHFLAFVQQQKFNAIRLPFDHDRMLKNEILPDSDALAFAPELVNLPYAHAFVTIAHACARVT